MSKTSMLRIILNFCILNKYILNYQCRIVCSSSKIYKANPNKILAMQFYCPPVAFLLFLQYFCCIFDVILLYSCCYPFYPLPNEFELCFLECCHTCYYRNECTIICYALLLIGKTININTNQNKDHGV